MVRIIAYAYEADLHCASCTKEDSHRTKLDHNHPYAVGESCKDDNGVEYDLVDRSGDLIMPIFSTDPIARRHVCGDCFGDLDQ